MIPNLKKICAEFEALAQKLTDVAHVNKRQIRINFPSGHIRRLCDLKERWPYLSQERQRTLACIIQLCDVNQWHLNTWNLGLTAGTVWEWHCTLPVVAVIETLLYEFGIQHRLVSKDAEFKKVINCLNSKGVYEQALRDKLHELREYRNEVHLYLKGKVKMHDGKPKRYNGAVLTLEEVEKKLLEYVKTHQSPCRRKHK